MGDATVSMINPTVEPGVEKYLYEELKLIDNDSEIIKLKKLEKNKLISPPHASLFIKTFPSENQELLNKKIRKINIQPRMSREENVMANLSLEHCTPEMVEKIGSLVNKCSMQFYMDGDMLGKADIIQHKIYLKPGTPILFTRHFRLSHTMRKDVIRETRMMEEQSVIQKSVSPFNTPAFMVKK